MVIFGPKLIVCHEKNSIITFKLDLVLFDYAKIMLFHNYSITDTNSAVYLLSIPVGVFSWGTNSILIFCSVINN